MKLRNNLLSLSAILFFTHFAQAQMCPCQFGKDSSKKPFRYEIGINGFTSNEQLINFSSNRSYFQNNYIPGIKIKRHFDNFSARIGFDYTESKYQFDTEEEMNWNKNLGSNYSKTLKLGIEKTVLNKSFQIFVAADLILLSASYSGITEGRGDIAPYYKYPYNFKLNALGISPSLGLKYRPIERISISLETSLSIIYWQTKGNQAAYRNERSTTLVVNPIGLLSLNYHLLR
jgi:hypothetical protein